MTNVCGYRKMICRHKWTATLDRGSVIFQFMGTAHLEDSWKSVITATVTHTVELAACCETSRHTALLSFFFPLYRPSFFRHLLSLLFVHFSSFSSRCISFYFHFSSLGVFPSPSSCTSSCLARVWLWYYHRSVEGRQADAHDRSNAALYAQYRTAPAQVENGSTACET
jgi:hypothetical protein